MKSPCIHSGHTCNICVNCSYRIARPLVDRTKCRYLCKGRVASPTGRGSAAASSRHAEYMTSRKLDEIASGVEDMSVTLEEIKDQLGDSAALDHKKLDQIHREMIT